MRKIELIAVLACLTVPGVALALSMSDTSVHSGSLVTRAEAPAVLPERVPDGGSRVVPKDPPKKEPERKDPPKREKPQQDPPALPPSVVKQPPPKEEPKPVKELKNPCPNPHFDEAGNPRC